MVRKRKHIVILGAGYAGLGLAIKLGKLSHNHKVTLIDKHDFHVYSADLYEVATAFNAEITDHCLTQLKATVATPVKDCINNKRVKFLQDTVIRINPKKKTIDLKKKGAFKYDVLAVCLGAVNNDYGIPGLKRYGMPLKTVEDALAINCHLDQYFHKLWKSGKRREVIISVGGGGATGVETAAEISHAVKKIARKYKYPRSLIEVHLVEGGDTLAGMEERGTRLICQRLHKKGIKIHLNHYITKVAKNSFVIKKGRRQRTINSDFLIWTGGVKVNPVVSKLGGPETRGAIRVTPAMQSLKHPEVFAAGDNAFFPDPKNPEKSIPMLGQFAFEQGPHLAKNIVRYLREEPLKPYRPHFKGMVVPVGTKHAVFKRGRIVFQGVGFWFLRRLITLRYCLNILPFWKAIRKWQHSHKIFVQND